MKITRSEIKRRFGNPYQINRFNAQFLFYYDNIDYENYGTYGLNYLVVVDNSTNKAFLYGNRGMFGCEVENSLLEPYINRIKEVLDTCHNYEEKVEKWRQIRNECFEMIYEKYPTK